MDPITEMLGRVEHVAEASDADLAEIETDLLDLFAQVKAGEVEHPGDIIEMLTKISDAVKVVRGEAETRIAVAAERAEQIAALEAELIVAEDTDDESDDDEKTTEKTTETERKTTEKVTEPSAEDAADVVAEAEQIIEDAEPAEAVTAAAPALPALSDVARRSPQPRIEMTTALDRTIRLVASGQDVPWGEFAQAMVDARESMLAYSGGGTDKIKVGRFDWRDQYGSDRTLEDGDNRGNTAKVNALVSAAMQPDSWDEDGNPAGSLLASGGFCAPTPALYDLAQISRASRPVRDSLPSFNADRGGIRFTTPPNMAGVLVDVDNNAVGDWTKETDANPQTAVKEHQTIACGTVVEAFVKAIYTHVQIGNFMTRAYPEWVAVWMDNIAAAHARFAEQELLNAILASSTVVTEAQFFGTTRDLLGALVQLATGEKNRQRMDPEARLRLLLPDWILASMQMDGIRFGYTDVKVPTRESLRALFGQVGVNVSFYEDSATGAGQIVAAQGAGANIRNLPTTVQWFLYHEGAHVFLDGGTLDLGLVRDSALIETNDYRIFSESWEGHAYRGIFSYAGSSTICASGAGALGEDSSGICAAS